MSRVAEIGAQVVTCTYDVDASTKDMDAHRSASMTSIATRPRTVFTPPVLPADRMIRIGEVLFQTNPRWTVNSPDNPPVRSVLNGIIVKGIAPDTHVNAKRAAMRKMMQPIGFSRKDIAVVPTNSGSFSVPDKPVALDSGMFTATNLGQKPIEVGQAMQIRIPNVDVQKQYSDGTTQFSENRAVCEFVTLKMKHTLAGWFGEQTENDEVEAARPRRQDEPAFVPERRGMLNTLIRAMPDADQARISQLMLHGDPHFRHNADALLALTRAAIMQRIGRKYLGVASTGADKGRKLNINQQPLTNLVSRAVDYDLRKVDFVPHPVPANGTLYAVPAAPAVRAAPAVPAAPAVRAAPAAPAAAGL